MKKVKQSLVRSSTFEAREALNVAPLIRADKGVPLEVRPGPGQPDLIAKEILHPKCCYGKYTHPKSLHAISDLNVIRESQG